MVEEHKGIEIYHEPELINITTGKIHSLTAVITGIFIQLVYLGIIVLLVALGVYWGWNWSVKYDFYLLTGIWALLGIPLFLFALGDIYRGIIYFFNQQNVVISNEEIAYFSKPFPLAGKNYLLKKDILKVFAVDEAVGGFQFASDYSYSIYVCQSNPAKRRYHSILYRYFNDEEKADAMAEQISNMLNNAILDKELVNYKIKEEISNDSMKIKIKREEKLDQLRSIVLYLFMFYSFSLWAFALGWNFQNLLSVVGILVLVFFALVSIMMLFQSFYNENLFSMDKENVLYKQEGGSDWFSSDKIKLKSADILKVELNTLLSKDSPFPLYEISLYTEDNNPYVVQLSIWSKYRAERIANQLRNVFGDKVDLQSSNKEISN